MAKKTSSKKKKRSPKKKAWTAEKILNLWETTCVKAAKPKVFEKRIFSQFEPKLLKAIQQRLDGPPPLPPHTFEARDEQNTRILAGLLGKICRQVTLDKATKEVDFDTFQKVFGLIKGNPKCPSGGGGGEWCSIT